MRNDVVGNAIVAKIVQLLSAAGRWIRATRWLPYALILLAVLSGFGFVYAFGVNLFWADDWAERPFLLSKYANGTLGLSDLWECHNEHRILFPKMVMLGLGLLTHGNVVADMYFSEVELLIVLGIFFAACRKQLPPKNAAWLMVPIAFLVFSLRQHENMIWGFQIAFIMVVATAVSTFFCLSRVGNDRWAAAFLGAVLVGVVGAYSSIQGLLIWPVGLGQLAISSLSKRRKIVFSTAWAILGVGVWMLYFWNWHKPGHHPPLAVSLEYFIAAIGGALSCHMTEALIGGAVLLGMTAAALGFVVAKRQWSEHSFWLATIAFSLTTLAAIMTGRCGFGTHQALASRYATFSIPVVIAVYVILASQNRETPNRLAKHLMRGTLILAILGVSASFVRGVRIEQISSEDRDYQRFVTYTFQSQPDEAITSYPVKADLRIYANMVKPLHCNVFADDGSHEAFELPDPSLPVAAVPTGYGLDDVQAKGDMLLIGGWAVDLPAKDAAGGVSVVIDGKERPSYYGLRRNDVAHTLNNRKLQCSGFRCPMPLKDFAPGRHSVVLKVLSNDRRKVYEITGQIDIGEKCAWAPKPTSRTL
jgi:hypothetical protein